MRTYELDRFGLDHLRLVENPTPEPGAGEIRIRVEALSLNFRDLMVIKGHYNPRLALPVVPLSDGAGVVTAVGPGVTEVAVGNPVMSHFVAGWQEGPYRGDYVTTTLGTPGPGLAAEEVVLPADAVLPIPKGFDMAQAATLPIAALTAWSALVTEGGLERGQTVLTLGTGGVSIFALSIGRAMGANVIVTSSSDEKLARAKGLGATGTINYVTTPRWHEPVLEATGGTGADVVVENGGIGTLPTSLRAVRAGGTVAMLGALTGLQGEINLSPLLMKRIRLAGILVDSRAVFRDLVSFLESPAQAVTPIIDSHFPFEKLPDALRHMEQGQHFGKIVIEV